MLVCFCLKCAENSWCKLDINVFVYVKTKTFKAIPPVHIECLHIPLKKE